MSCRRKNQHWKLTTHLICFYKYFEEIISKVCNCSALYLVGMFLALIQVKKEQQRLQSTSYQGCRSRFNTGGNIYEAEGLGSSARKF